MTTIGGDHSKTPGGEGTARTLLAAHALRLRLGDHLRTHQQLSLCQAQGLDDAVKLLQTYLREMRGGGEWGEKGWDRVSQGTATDRQPRLHPLGLFHFIVDDGQRGLGETRRHLTNRDRNK